MNRILFASIGALYLAVASGCAMCDSSLDATYGAYGGKWQRHDPCYGRVGSLFAPAGAAVVAQEAQIAPAQQGDDAQQSILVPGGEGPSEEPFLDEVAPEGPLLPDQSSDELSQDTEPGGFPPVEVDMDSVQDESAEPAAGELGPPASEMQPEPDSASESDPSSEPAAVPETAPADAEMESADELPDFLEGLDLKREPGKPLQPSETGDLPPLVPSPDLDEQ